MKLLDEYLENQNKIYEYFGYKENWHVYPIQDMRDYYWSLDDHGTEMWYAESEQNAKALVAVEYEYDDESVDSSDVYSDESISDLMRGEEFSAMLVDTNTDGNKFFAIFDNKKEIKEEQ
jgi:hypothetical protein